jgi:hypothetical protein
MPSTYTPIATATVSGTSTTSITFSGIASTYTDLILQGNAATISGANSSLVTINADNSAIYSVTYLEGNGSSASSSILTGTGYVYGPSGGTSFGTYQFTFPNYSNTNIFKTALARGGPANSSTSAWINLYRSTSAITSLKFEIFGTTLIAGTTMSLYGIKAA